MGNEESINEQYYKFSEFAFVHNLYIDSRRLMCCHMGVGPTFHHILKLF